jgi:histidine ammonia-lyase
VYHREVTMPDRTWADEAAEALADLDAQVVRMSGEEGLVVIATGPCNTTVEIDRDGDAYCVYSRAYDLTGGLDAEQPAADPTPDLRQAIRDARTAFDAAQFAEEVLAAAGF